MPRPLPLTVLFLLQVLCTPFSYAASVFSPYLEINSLSYSEPISIGGLLDNWQGDLSDGEQVFSQQRVAIGVGFPEASWGTFAIGWHARYDYFLRFTPDTATLAYQSENDLPTTVGKRYNLSLAMQHNRSQGPQVHYQSPWFKLESRHKLKLGMRVNLLESEELIDGSIAGYAQLHENDQYDIALDVDYHYFEDALFARPMTDAPQSKGLSVDLFAQWQYKRLQAWLTVIDAYYHVKWDSAPFTTAAIDSNTRDTDENGFIRYNPVLSGLEGNHHYIQKLPHDIHLKAQYEINPTWSTTFDNHRVANSNFYQLGIVRKTKSQLEYGLAYQVPTQAITIELTSHYFSIALTSDSLSKNEAKQIGLNMGIRY